MRLSTRFIKALFKGFWLRLPIATTTARAAKKNIIHLPLDYILQSYIFFRCFIFFTEEEGRHAACRAQQNEGAYSLSTSRSLETLGRARCLAIMRQMRLRIIFMAFETVNLDGPQNRISSRSWS